MFRRLRRWLGRNRPKPEIGSGWYRGHGEVMPFDSRPLLMVSAKVARRLQLGDSIVFEVSPAAPRVATNVRITHRPMPMP